MYFGRSTVTGNVLLSIALIVSFLLGLGPPRSHTILFLASALIFCGKRLVLVESCQPVWMKHSTMLLGAFGVSYSIMQIIWGVWHPNFHHIGEILSIVVLPAMCLQAGWLLPRLAVGRISSFLVLFGLGSLVFVCLSLYASFLNGWQIGEVFSGSNNLVHLPWPVGSGESYFVHMRSVEQRAFFAFTWLPLGASLVFQKPISKRYKIGIILLFLAVLAGWTILIFGGRLGILTLILALLPCFCVCLSQVYAFASKILKSKDFLVLALVAMVVGLVGIAYSIRFRMIPITLFCDERASLQFNFISRMGLSPWGGRQLEFLFNDCKSDLFSNPYQLVFSSTETSSPHSVFLDVYNDVGWPGFACLILAMTPLIYHLIIGFSRLYLQEWNLSSQLRWGYFIVIIVQWFCQPLIYSDGLLFASSFVFIGSTLSEFHYSSIDRRQP